MFSLKNDVDGLEQQRLKLESQIVDRCKRRKEYPNGYSFVRDKENRPTDNEQKFDRNEIMIEKLRDRHLQVTEKLRSLKEGQGE